MSAVRLPFIFAFFGAMSVAYIPKTLMQYAVFFLLIVMAVYTFIKKDLGKLHTQIQCGKKQIMLGIGFGGGVGLGGDGLLHGLTHLGNVLLPALLDPGDHPLRILEGGILQQHHVDADPHADRKSVV